VILLPALTLTRSARRWLESSPDPAVLHVFDAACNLINGRGEVLSLVTPAIGPGPFSIVVEAPPGGFTRWVAGGSAIGIEPDLLRVGGLRIDLNGAALWEASLPATPLPADPPASLRSLLDAEGEADSPFLKGGDPRLREIVASALDALGAGLSARDGELIREASARLAGLGAGLTPAGDDFLMGVIYAVHARIAPPENRRLAGAILAGAAGRTARLSSAWLGAAAEGEAGERWKTLLAALSDLAPSAQVDAAARRVIHRGHSSGTDSLAGFLWGAGQLK
jgi:hypothetical protein